MFTFNDLSAKKRDDYNMRYAQTFCSPKLARRFIVLIFKDALYKRNNVHSHKSRNQTATKAICYENKCVNAGQSECIVYKQQCIKNISSEYLFGIACRL